MPTDIAHQNIIMQEPGRLLLNPKNARTHSPGQVRRIAASIESFGFTNPILVDENNMVLAGHGRLAAAKRLKLASVPTLCLSGLSDAERRAYVLADNRLAEKAGWDRNLLALELGELAALLPTLEVDWTVEVTGFESGEIELLQHDRSDASCVAEDDLPEDDGSPATSRIGDLWQLGPHRILCGDARSEADFARLFAGEKAAMVFTDPPYNVRIAGHVTRSTAKAHKDFVMASGEMSSADYRSFLSTVLKNSTALSVPGAVHYVCMDWRHIADLLAAGEQIYDALLNICVWDKGTAGQGSFYRSRHEMVAVYRVPGGPHRNNVALGAHGRNRSNLWPYAGLAGFGRDRKAALAMHPTVKPVLLVADAIRDCTLRDDLVFDPFLGSGTTLIAAEKLGRRCYGLEYDPRYVDVIVRRWEAYSGHTALHADDGQPFDEIARERARTG